MSSLLNPEILPYIIGGSVAAISVLFFMKRRLFKKPIPIWPKDTVILHQLGRGPYAPSMSPFPLKLETFLRMARIPYQNDHENGMSSKGKTPWITYNSEDVADSQFSIEYLKEKLTIDLNNHLSPEERAVARAFQKMIEENLYWFLVIVRWDIHFDSKFMSMALKQIPMVRYMMWIIPRMVRNQTKAQGHGRHSQSELWSMFTQDLNAISDFLGNKQFLMGDEPSEVDCAAFGMLAQIKWQIPGSPHEKYFNDETPKLGDYCDRMKELFWPDWDKCITHGGTVDAEK